MNRKYAEYLLEKTKEDYNRIAEEFSRTRSRVWEEIRFLFDDWLVEGDKVLDLGCGNGRFFEVLKDKNVDYIGIDSSEKLIKIARKRYPQAKFQVADALNLLPPNNYFNKVFSIAVLHHIPSEEFRLKFLKEAKRALKQDGLLILTVWKFRTKKELPLIFKYTILRLIGKSKLDFRDIFEPWGKKIKRYYHCFSKKELINLVKKAGFKVLERGLIRNERGNRNNIYLVAKKSR